MRLTKSQRNRRNKTKREWKTLAQIGNPYGLSKKQLGTILCDHEFIDKKGNVTEKALNENIAKNIQNKEYKLNGYFWNKKIVTKLLVSLGHQLCNPFLEEARGVAKEIFHAWKNGDKLAIQNQDKLAIWSYEEGMYEFETFLKKLPENWRMDAIAEVCRSLTNKKMTHDTIEIIFQNAKCGITMADIQEQWAIEQRDEMKRSLIGVEKSDVKKSKKM